MRLVNIHTLQFKDFFDKDVPPYHILSHRWGEDEVSYKEFRKGQRQDASGYQKVLDFCNFVKNRVTSAASDAFDEWPQTSFEWMPESLVEWVWIDTICIDKRSSAELSEAINSMFQWYRQSAECIVYLKDVEPEDQQAAFDPASLYQPFKRSQWFKRGWTLQELLAPAMVVFCDKQWRIFGHKCASDAGNIPCRVRGNLAAYGPCLLRTWLWSITDMPPGYLKGGQIVDAFYCSAAQKMSWASSRETTRTEDEAYCLFGLFGINMPLLYGEGHRAFDRLQEEIIRKTGDQSIFAWTPRGPPRGPPALLASSVKDFQDSGNVHSRHQYGGGPKRIMSTSEGIEMQATLSTACMRDIRRSASRMLQEFVRRRGFDDTEPLYFLKLACKRLDLSQSGQAIWSDVELVLTEGDVPETAGRFMRWWELGLGEHTSGFHKEELDNELITIRRGLR